MELKFLRVLIILFTRLIACVQDLLVLTDLLTRCAIWLAITCHNEAGTLYSFFFYLYGSNLVKQPWNAPTADSSGDVIHPDHICRSKMAIPLHVKARQAEYQGKVKRFPSPRREGALERGVGRVQSRGLHSGEGPIHARATGRSRRKRKVSE